MVTTLNINAKQSAPPGPTLARRLRGLEHQTNAKLKCKLCQAHMSTPQNPEFNTNIVIHFSILLFLNDKKTSLTCHHD